jgi:two-component system nitrate/nitrite sensor histidine kinase NarX
VSKTLAALDVEKARMGLEELQAVVQATYEDIREAIDQFSTDVTGRPLLPALAEYIQEFSQRNVLPVEFQAPDFLRQLTPQAELQLLRIAQEALTNVRKHARATHVWVTLEQTPEEVRLVVKDDGQGVDAPADPDPAVDGRHGRNVMRERAEELGGTVKIQSVPGQGTELSVALPGEKVRH